ncbi:hypothetical protein QBC34DRAFT_375096 [Podospora aff. communis PSN243]|uniref:Uncharacterized protein n=1 Tax=Podospora aff. communis PSN243 TaxID=3040156 RepID=A0AAV9H2J2_9PEZI|nr:hypothetical protein QBC34DRAFT_375096 [Podospora aff. communis PSN243]
MARGGPNSGGRGGGRGGGPAGSGRGGRGGRGGGPSTSGLPLPDDYVVNNSSSAEKNKGKAPGKAPAPKVAVFKPPPPVIPMPWDIDPVIFPKPEPVGANKIAFNYKREWVSYGVRRDQVGDKLRKDLLRQKRIELPAILKGVSDGRLKEFRQMYADAGELELFKSRCDHVNEGGLTRLIFQSPLVQKSHPKYEGCKQDKGLTKVLRVAELGAKIMRHLMPSLRDISALAGTCRDAAFSVTSGTEVWDATTGDFDMDRFKDSEGVRQDVLCIAASQMKQTKTTTPYMDGWNIMEKFIRGVVETSSSYRDVVIDQLPFFDLRMLELMIQSMPNLETLAISRCVLLDVTKLGPLIEVVKRHARTDAMGNKSYVKVDFAPYFFEGPNDANRLGCYGVTHHEPNFHIPKAVMALTLRYFPEAAEIGMDILSDSSSFWSFVCRLPGPDALWHVKARDAYVARNQALLKMRPNLRNIPAYKSIPASDSIESVFADEMTAAVTGDGVGAVYVPSAVKTRCFDLPTPITGGYGWWRIHRRCRVCKVELPESLFSLQRTRCWGCEMVEFVDEMEDSHFRYRMTAAITRLVRHLGVQKGVRFPANSYGAFADARLGVQQGASFADIISAERSSHLQCAIDIVRDTDNAWAYHLLNPTGKDARPAWPEVPLFEHDEDDQATMRRLRNLIHTCKAVDFRMGGPQYLHSGRVHFWPRNLESCVLLGEKVAKRYKTAITDQDPGSESFVDFMHRWQWSELTDLRLEERLSNTPHVTAQLDAKNITMKEHVSQMKFKRLERLFAANLEWKVQCSRDKRLQLHFKAQTEDYTTAGIGPEHTFRPYSRDKQKEAVECLGADYLRDGTYMQGAE